MINAECARTKVRPYPTYFLGVTPLPKKEYLDRHNGVAQYVHHAICQSYKIQTCKKWHVHKPPEIMMLKDVEILYDTPLTTDRPHVFNRPDIVVRDKKNKKCFIIDVSCPNDINVSEKEQEKIAKYGGLRQGLGRMWYRMSYQLSLVD